MGNISKYAYRHFYHIPSKERAAKLLNKLQQDPHESIGEYIQTGSEIIQVHSGKIKGNFF